MKTTGSLPNSYRGKEIQINWFHASHWPGISVQRYNKLKAPCGAELINAIIPSNITTTTKKNPKSNKYRRCLKKQFYLRMNFHILLLILKGVLGIADKAFSLLTQIWPWNLCNLRKLVAPKYSIPYAGTLNTQHPTWISCHPFLSSNWQPRDFYF